MSETDTLARPILRSRPAEQVKNALVVLRIDAAAVICDLKDATTELAPTADGNITGNIRYEVFQGIVDQIGENLFDRNAVADKSGNGSTRIWALASAA